MKTLTWKTEQRKLKDLIAADYNPRKMTEQEKRDLESSLEEFGAVIPVVVNIGKRKNILIGGHQRVSIYQEKNVETVEVMVPSRELTGDEEKRLNLRLNKNTGSWDFEKLKDMGLELLLDVGFDDDELQTMFDDVEILDDDFNFGKAVADIKAPKTKEGDIYQLGMHRLMCGNAGDPLHVAKLIGKETADLIYIDPPMIKKGYFTYLQGIVQNAMEYAKPNVHMFYWCDEVQIGMVQQVFEHHKVDNKRVCMYIRPLMQ